LFKNFQKRQFQSLPLWAYGIFSRSDHAFQSSLAQPGLDIALVASDLSIDLNYPFIVVPHALVSITGYFMLGKSLINTLSPHLENAVAADI